MKKRQKLVLGTWMSVTAIVLVLLIILNSFAVSFDVILRDFFGTLGEGHSDGAEKTYISEYNTLEEAQTAFSEVANSAVTEGTVLLLNDNNALPLEKDSAISVFGMSSVLWMELEKISTSKDAIFADSMEDYGFQVNSELRKFYKKSSHTNWGTGDNKGNGDAAGDWRIDEIPQSEYTNEVKSSYADYSDAAIVVISRGGGEGGDLPRSMDRFGGSIDESYLELTTEEKELFEAIESAGCFNKTIVILHTSNPMQMDFMNDYNIDAILWVAGTGATGVESLPALIAGDISPSGRTVDTFSYDNFSAPAMQNFGDNRFVDENGDLTEFSYVNYAEGIYVGYQYYETRYEDVVTGRENAGNWDYDSIVYRPFGYGLSYSEFLWSNYQCDYDEKNDEFTVSVTVKNIGDYAAKEVVEVYLQSSYTEYDIANGIEKAAVKLCGFEKTETLNPGKTEKVEIVIPGSELRVYDANGAGTYILEAGDYYITAATNAHSAVNNILSAKGYSVNGDAEYAYLHSVEQTDTMRYAVGSSGTQITNQFDDSSLKDAKYLSRSNWSAMDNNGLVYATGTMDGVSNTTNSAGTVNISVVSDEVYNALSLTGWEAANNPVAINEFESITTGAINNIKLADMIGLEYNDEKWEQLLDQLTVEELHDLYKTGAYTTIALPSIEKPATHEYDGPEGIHYPNGTAQEVIGASWNMELAKKWGSVNGDLALINGYNGWYAPGVNIHRTPFSGRNFEYIAEDSYLTGAMAGAITEGAQAKGLNVVLKHMALNDQETNRGSNGSEASYAQEQAIREIYLRPFEICIVDHNALGIMNAMNRIGSTKCRANYALNVSVVREEWDFKGLIITDYNVMDQAESTACVAGGCDLQLYGSGNPVTEYESAGIQYMLREGAHHIFYFVVNSAAMNGYTHETSVSQGFAVYILLLIFIDLVILSIFICGILLKLRGYRLENNGCTDSDILKKYKKLKITYWTIVGLILTVSLIIFVIYGLPLLQQAFKIS